MQLCLFSHFAFRSSQFTTMQEEAAEKAMKNKSLRLAFHRVDGGYSRRVLEGVLDAIIEVI